MTDEIRESDRPDEPVAPGADAPDDTGREASPEPAAEGDGATGAGVEADLNALVEEARSKADEYLDLAQRTKADFDNYRKRMAGENQAALERGRLELAEGVIGAIDNLERVLEAAGIEQATALEGEIPTEAPIGEQGVVVAYRDLFSVLRQAGVEPFDSKDKPFDPNLHEALQALPADGVDPGLVIEVLQKGYRAGETVVRHARVVVSQ